MKQWAAQRERSLSEARAATTQKVSPASWRSSRAWSTPAARSKPPAPKLSEQVLRAVLPEAAL